MRHNKLRSDRLFGTCQFTHQISFRLDLVAGHDAKLGMFRIVLLQRHLAIEDRNTQFNSILHKLKFPN